MSTPNPSLSSGVGTQGQGIALPGLLNILVRGRKIIFGVTLLGLLAGVAYGIITRPLYMATAQVRPGIVAYTPQGGPLREWAIKDVVRWFRTGLFWVEMREQENFRNFKGAPDIMADFIPSGPQFMAGGDVITLKNLNTDPLLAMATLDIAINSFNRQASLDSLGSTMYLTMGGIRVRMAKIVADINQLEANSERVKLQIAQGERNLAQIDVKDRTLAAQMERVTETIALNRRMVSAYETQAADAKQRLVGAEQLMSQVLPAETGVITEGNAGGEDSLDKVLLRAVGREQAGNVSDLMSTINTLGFAVFHNLALADSVQNQVKSQELDLELLKLDRQVTLAKEKADLKQGIDELTIQLEYDIPTRRTQLQNDLMGERVQLELLSPLERIGKTVVSDKPVRPRKLRAATILTGLGFMGSLFLVLVLEYFRIHQAAILADKRG